MSTNAQPIVSSRGRSGQREGQKSSALTSPFIELMERGWLPDKVVRFGIRRLCKQRLDDLTRATLEEEAGQLQRFIDEMDEHPLAPVPEKANEQHYELPPAFFGEVLGVHRKYSGCYWGEGVKSLDEAEALALELSCVHADLQNGQRVLELGCGWGSLTLTMAERYPDSKITAVSNSVPQREHIMNVAAERGLGNLEVVTADMNTFEAEGQYDRIVSIEMFEHMRNYHALMGKVSSWLKTGGKLFVHVFAHLRHAYPFEVEGDENWMGRYFFTGGIMPSADLLMHFQKDMQCVKRWMWDGTHYQKTAEAWLANMDAKREVVMPIMVETYGEDEARRWFNRWRVFFLACTETFGYRAGREWPVVHYQFLKH